MIPVVFSGNRGWFYRPADQLPRRDGVVFFSAYGVEDLSTRASLARLAARLAAIGHPVLRFDLPGTGDSLGNWDDAASLPAWVAAGEDAVAALQRLSGSRSVSLLGLRLGGLVASLVARQLPADGQTVTRLALLAPILDGRQHMREWRALSDGSLPLTIAGFPINEALRQAIAGMTPEQFLTPPAPRIFLAIPGTAKYLPPLESEWRKQVPVCSVAYPDLAEHIGNPTLSRAPAALFERLLEWFEHDLASVPAAELTGAEPQVLLPAQASLVGDGFVEEGECLAIENGLAAVWCSPTRQPPAATVVFCNAGRNPHIGWARSSVSLARRLADHGIASLRFDLSGLGDSPAMAVQPPELLYSKAGIPQLREVLASVVRRHGPDNKICLLGACSGGYLAFHESLDDARVSGLLLVNVQRFIWEEGTSLQASMRTAGKSTQAYRQQAFSSATWKRLFGGQVDVVTVLRTLLSRAWAVALRAVYRIDQRLHCLFLQVLGQTPAAADDTPASVRQGFAALAARGTKTVVIYGEDDGGRDEFARYFGSTSRQFSDLPGARLVIIPDTDHDLTPLAARQQLFAEILASCQSPAAGSSPHLLFRDQKPA